MNKIFKKLKKKNFFLKILIVIQLSLNDVTSVGRDPRCS